VGSECRHAATARIRGDGKFMSLRGRRGRKLTGDVRLDVRYAHHDILRLDICVNKITLFMKILETAKDLFGDTFNDTRGKTFPAILLDEGKKVFAEWLEGDAYVGCRRDRVGERVEKVDNMRSSRMRRGCVGYLTKQLDFVPSRLRIPSGRLDNLQGGMTSL